MARARLGRGPRGGRAGRPLLPDPAHGHVRRGARAPARARERLPLLLHEGGAGRQARRGRGERGRLRGLRPHLPRPRPRRGGRAHRGRRAPRVAPARARGPRRHRVRRRRVRPRELPGRRDGRHDRRAHRRKPHLQLRRGVRRREHGHHARHPRRRPPVQHPAPDPHLRGARIRRARVRAPVDDPGPRRQEALEAPRRGERGGVLRARLPARRHGELPGAAGLVARRRDHPTSTARRCARSSASSA